MASSVLGVLAGFAVIWIVVAVGFVVGLRNVLGPQGQFVLGRIVFFVALPALLFTTLAKSNLHTVFSAGLLVQVIVAVVAFVLYILIARLWWKPPVPETIIGGMAASYVNANNMGVPVAAYVLGNASLVAPMMLFQLVVFAPLALAGMDYVLAGSGAKGEAAAKTTLFKRLLKVVENPVIIASILGLLVAGFGIHLPSFVMKPIDLIAGASVPCALLAFGMSLTTIGHFERTPGRHDTTVAVIIKLVVQPVVAWVVAGPILGMSAHLVFSCVAIATLPTAQNIFNYAQRYERGRVIARNAVFITTLAALPIMVIVALLLK